MPIENVRVVVQGANPQTFTVQANIDANGNATVTFPVTGSSIGTDLVQAFLDIMATSSNQSQVVWQGSNGPIAVSPIQVYFQHGTSGSVLPSGLNASGFTATQVVDSLMFNTHPSPLLPGYPNASANLLNPMVNNATTITGGWSNDIQVAGDNGGSIYLALVGSFVVAQAGNIDFTSYANQGYVLGCPGATFVSGAATFNGVANTPIMNYPALAGRNGSWPGGTYAVDNFTLNFPTPGVYAFEIIFASGSFSERQFDLLALGTSVIPPVNMQPIPPAPPAGTGSLILTPNSAGPDIAGNSQTFTLQISGLAFQSIPYIPVFEGNAGTLYLSNQSGSTNFSFPALPSGAAVDYAAAIATLLALSGDNASWQGRVALGTGGGNIKLSFNGSSPDANIPTTQLTVTAKDLAWFNPVNKAFDSFAISSQGGGSQTTVQINWLIQPTIASVGPTSLPGDGYPHTIAVNLSKPLPPLQSGIQTAFSASGGMAIGEVLTNTNSQGFITGWTLTVTTPLVGEATDVSLSLTASDTLTFLSGTGFQTQTVTYISQQIADITLNP